MFVGLMKKLFVVLGLGFVAGGSEYKSLGMCPLGRAAHVPVMALSYVLANTMIEILFRKSNPNYPDVKNNPGARGFVKNVIKQIILIDRFGLFKNFWNLFHGKFDSDALLLSICGFGFKLVLMAVVYWLVYIVGGLSLSLIPSTEPCYESLLSQLNQKIQSWQAARWDGRHFPGSTPESWMNLFRRSWRSLRQWVKPPKVLPDI